MYILDTNACIRILNKSSELLVERLNSCDPDKIFLCAIVKVELVYGAYHSTKVAANLRLLKRFFEPFISLPFDDRCVEQYGRIRADWARMGTPIGPNDLMIAATAVTHDLTLITHNTNEFSRVTGLDYKDWEAD